MLRQTLVRMQRPAMISRMYSLRAFGLTKYKFDDEDYVPNVFQKSNFTHLTNAEELIN